MVVWGIASTATIVGMIWWSKRSDRLKERKLHTLLPYLFADAGWMLTASSSPRCGNSPGSWWLLPATLPRWSFSVPP